MTAYRCRFPDRSVKDFYTLPEPPEGAKWVYEGSAYSFERYYLDIEPFYVTFSTDYGEKRVLCDKIPLGKDLPPIPYHRGQVGYWDVPSAIC